MAGLIEWSIRENVKDLADEDRRVEAVKSLKTFGARAVPHLVEALGDPGRQAFASVALSEIGEPAIPALLDALGDESKGAFAAVTFNEMMKKRSGTQKIFVPGLITVLEDKRRQTYAFVALEHLGPQTLEPYLSTLIHNLENVNSSALARRLLISVGKPAVGPLLSLASDRNLQEPIEQILLEIAKNDKTVQLPATLVKHVQVSELSPPPPSMARARFCTNCGTKADPSDKFCRSCGAALKAP